MSHASSRHGSIASIWSSADVPFFLDARRSNDAGRKGSIASSSRWMVDGQPSGPRTTGSSSGGSYVDCPVNEHISGDYRELPFGPTSPRPSVDSGISRMSFAGPHHSPERRQSSRLAERLAKSRTSSHSISRRLDSINDEEIPPEQPVPESKPVTDLQASNLKGFQHRKPATLQIQPVAYSSPLNARVSSKGEENINSPGASTVAPSLGTSPVPSQNTDASADLATPSTNMGSPRVVKPQNECKGNAESSMLKLQRADSRHSSLYARAGQFFRSDYSMATPPMTAHDFRSQDAHHQVLGLLPPTQGQESNSTAEQSVDGPGTTSIVLLADSETSEQCNRLDDLHQTWRSAPAKPLESPRSGYHGPHLAVSASPSAHSHRLQEPILLDGSHPTSTPDNLQPHRFRTFARPSWIQSIDAQPQSSRALSADVRPRTMSTPRLNAAWLVGADPEIKAAARKASFCVGANETSRSTSSSSEQSSPASRLLHLRMGSVQSALPPVQVGDDLSSSGHSMRSGNLDNPPSPRGAKQLFRQVSRSSRLGPASTTSIASKGSGSNEAAPAGRPNTKQSTTSRPKSANTKSGGWSSYLQEGLTLYLDQGSKREVALKLAYLRYDPFGRPETLIEVSSSADAGKAHNTVHGTPKKAKLRPLSARDGEDDVGTLEFGFSAYTPQIQPQSIVFSSTECAPILRHLGIGEDTRADLLTRQAALSLDENGIHEVSGSERSRRIAWRFLYEVLDVPTDHGMPSAKEKMLRPVSFSCSATLLDPAKARKARLFKMMKKGVASNLASSLVHHSPGRARSGSVQNESSILHAGVSLPDSDVSPTAGASNGWRASRKVSLYPGSYGTRSSASASRRPSEMTTSSTGSIQRLAPGCTPIPPGLPNGVVPFRFRPGTDTVTPARSIRAPSHTLCDPSTTKSLSPQEATSDDAVDHDVTQSSRYARSARSTRIVKVTDMAQASSLTRASHGDIFARPGLSQRAMIPTRDARPGSTATKGAMAGRPATASEEIKMAYLQRNLERDRERQQQQQLEEPGEGVSTRGEGEEEEEDQSTPTQELYPTQVNHLVQNDYSLRSVSSTPRLGNDRNEASQRRDIGSSSSTVQQDTFSTIKTQSRHRLRQAISTKALPDLPSGSRAKSLLRKARPITAQNLGPTNSSATRSPGSPGGDKQKAGGSGSLLVELGFI